jgi:hypothetical protein
LATFDEAREALVADHGLGALLVQGAFELSDQGLPSRGILPGLELVLADHVAPAVHDHFLDGQILVYLLVTARPAQHVLLHFLAAPHAAAQDVVEGRLLVLAQELDRALGDHPPVRDQDHAADVEALTQERHHLAQRHVVGGVAGEDLPGDRPAVLVNDDAQDELGQVAAAVARVAPLAPSGLAVAPDVDAGGVEEDDVQALVEEVSILQEQALLELGPHVEKEAGRAVEVLEHERVEARRLHRLDPARSLQVRSRTAQALQRHREDRSLHVEVEPPILGQRSQDLGQPLRLPQPLEHQRRSPGSAAASTKIGRGTRPLDDAQPLAEAA